MLQTFTDRKTRCRLYFLNRDWWEGVWGRRNLPQKSSTVLSEPKFGPHPPPPPPKSNIRELAPDYYKLRSSQLFYFKVRQSLLKFATTGITKYDDYYKLGQYTLVTSFKVCKSHTYFQKGGRKKCARDNHER